MASNAVNTGSSGQLVLAAEEAGYDVNGNWSDINWAFYLVERVQSNSTWVGGGVGASISATVDGVDQGVLWGGSFGFDWRPAGLQTTLIASGTVRFGHKPDGSSAVTLGCSIASTGTSGAGGPASVLLNVPVTKLTRVPGKPTGVSATRISDTQVRVDWTNTGASNGQPTRNQIYRSVNGGAWTKVADVNATNTATIGVAANQKLRFYVTSSNSAGTSPNSDPTGDVFTTPGAPSNVLAAKNAALDIVVTFDENVAYSEYNHEVWHGVVAGGVTTWDGAALATLPSGTLSYTHTAPNAAQVHIYRVRAKQGTLLSAYAQSNSVQLLVAPNKPTVPAIPSFADKASAFTFAWVHNSVDTTAQTAYEFAYSTDGGTTWTSTGKTASTAQQYVIAANTYAANATLTMRVRTWGQATTGGSDGTGASPWSDVKAVTFKTRPTTSITTPANGSIVNDASVRVYLSFAQPEGATFVKAELQLSQTSGGTVVLENKESTQQNGTRLDTQLQNGQSYSIRARVLDSNGIWSSYVTNTFNVVYLAPALPVVGLSYLEESGWGQIDLAISEPGAGESAPAYITITRRIGNGPEETLINNFPTSPQLSLFDTTPTIHGTNVYTITVTSALGAQRTVSHTLETEECRRAFLSKGNGFNSVVVFGGNLEVDIATGVASATMQAAGRTKPIGLFGVETSKVLKVSSFIFEREGFSTLVDLEAFLLVPGRACYRDASGRRVFGIVKGSVDYTKTTRGNLKFSITETD